MNVSSKSIGSYDEAGCLALGGYLAIRLMSGLENFIKVDYETDGLLGRWRQNQFFQRHMWKQKCFLLIDLTFQKFSVATQQLNCRFLNKFCQKVEERTQVYVFMFHHIFISSFIFMDYITIADGGIGKVEFWIPLERSCASWRVEGQLSRSFLRCPAFLLFQRLFTTFTHHLAVLFEAFPKAVWRKEETHLNDVCEDGCACRVCVCYTNVARMQVCRAVIHW